ncbi:LamG-like jellyroll fold domain-containing protein, partial [Streptomyces sp. MS06]|uniref:LamG-like jellyroll fold domain-containing protein n=1 Tax=Streptomyces sp. MS06 TaxID=3385974 RepID=UPI0039A1009E
WQFGRLNADGSFTSVASDEIAATDSMVRLTGIYDAQSGTITLYVGGFSDGGLEGFEAQAGTGDFAVGKGFTSSAWGHYLPGRIADVRIWSGAMAGWQQVSETVGE